MSVGTSLPVISEWLREILTADATLNAWVVGRIFEDYAPEDSIFPVIVFQHQASVSVRGVGVTVVMDDTLYVVKAIAQVNSYTPLQPIANRIEELVAGAGSIVRPQGAIIGTAKDAPFQLAEVDAGRQYRHLGGVFKIYAVAS